MYGMYAEELDDRGDSASPARIHFFVPSRYLLAPCLGVPRLYPSFNDEEHIIQDIARLAQVLLRS